MIMVNLPWDNVERLGSTVIGYVKDQASLVSQIQDNIEWLQTTLLNLNDKIKDRMNNVLQDVIYDGQDILEEFGVLAYSKPIGWVYLIKKIALRIKNLKDTVESLPDEDNFRNQRPPGENNQPNLTTSHVLLDPFQPVGMHSQKQDIDNLLAGPGPNIIATVGMGCVGKSRLLQHVFDDSTIHLKIWLSVPQTFSVEQLQRDIAARIWDGSTRLQYLRYFTIFGSRDSFFNEFNEGSEVTRMIKMTQLLEVFPSLIVFDNVWSPEERWLERIGLVGTRSKCKILISTRNRNVLKLMRAHRHVEIAPLSQIDSRTLFCLHAFANDQFPEELREVGHLIVDECKGIPLAIKETAREMANVENRAFNWNVRLEQIRMGGLPRSILSKLKLSFDSMPNHVKHLFLYWSFFHKEDRNIDSEYLLSLWEAENRLSIGDALGVASRPRENLMNFLEELYNACLIEKEEHIEKEKNFCIMQDLLRDLCIHISKENNWVFDVDGVTPLAANRHCRRLSLPKMKLQISSFPARIRCSPALRALSLSGNEGIKNIDIRFFSKMKVLRVLDVSGTSIMCLPKCMKQMKLLRVLNMSSTRIRELPGCVKHLKRLELLDISECTLLVTLPKWIRKLEWLRHLNILGANISFPYSHLPRKLLILRGVNERPWELEDPKCFENLQEVHLVLRGNNATPVQDALFASRLEIKVLSLKPHGDYYLVLSANISMMTGLKKLNIERFQIEDRIANFESLQFLRLNGCMYKNFPPLQNMNSLRKLELANDNSCRELPREFGTGFPNLEWLKISNFTALETLPELEDGRLRNCDPLYVENCGQLQNRPGRWTYL